MLETPHVMIASAGVADTLYINFNQLIFEEILVQPGFKVKQFVLSGHHLRSAMADISVAQIAIVQKRA
ncbi:MAG: hypothetical protein PVI54_09710 [Desulfobacteraceae bacterium]